MIFDLVNGALDKARYSSLNSIADETDRVESRVAIEAFGAFPDFKEDGVRMKEIPANEVLDMLNRHGALAIGMESELPQTDDDKHHLRRIFEQINQKHARIGGALESDMLGLKEMTAAAESFMGTLDEEDDGMPDYFKDKGAAVSALESFIGNSRPSAAQMYAG